MKTDGLDWIVRGGTVADGLGGEPVRADVGVAGEVRGPDGQVAVTSRGVYQVRSFGI